MQQPDLTELVPKVLQADSASSGLESEAKLAELGEMLQRAVLCNFQP